MKILLLSAALIAALSTAALAEPLPGAITNGSGNQTGTSTTTIIPAPSQAGYKIHVTAVQCKNTGTVTTIVTLNDPASTVVMVPAGSGDNPPFWPAYLTLPANTALTFTPMAASSTIYCNAQGYISPNS